MLQVSLRITGGSGCSFAMSAAVYAGRSIWQVFAFFGETADIGGFFTLFNKIYNDLHKKSVDIKVT